MANVLLINKFHSLVHRNGKLTKEIDPFVFGTKAGLVAKLFGCWHDNLSRPFTQNKTAYRSCLECGARKQFNPETLETHGNFYFPPIVKSESVSKI
jgi:hypothetical protein